MPKKTKKLNAIEENTGAFRNLLKLLGVFSEASYQLKEMEADLNQARLELADEIREDYAELQLALTQSETALEGICRAHPKWFAAKKSIATPYGKVAFHKSSKTEIPNEELTMLLIEQHGEQCEEFDASLYIRTAKELDKEALEKLPAELLKRFRVLRTEKANFSVSEAKIDMGKAVKEAAEKEAA